MQTHAQPPRLLKPVQTPFTPEVAAVLDNYPKGKDGYIIQLFRVFANSQRFLTSKGVVNLLDKDSPLTLRQREIVILRVTANNNCEYEWGVHVSAFAEAAGLNRGQINATRSGKADAACWTAEETALIRCVDDLCRTAAVSDGNLDDFSRYWDLPQQLEILALCGNYHTISFVANTARLPAEADAARFPSDRAAGA